MAIRRFVADGRGAGRAAMSAPKRLKSSGSEDEETFFDFSVRDAVVFTADYWARLARALKQITDAGDVGSQQRIAAIHKVFWRLHVVHSSPGQGGLVKCIRSAF